jgi:hypothetical protein
MELSKKQLATEAKRNRRPVTVETGRPAGHGWDWEDGASGRNKLAGKRAPRAGETGCWAFPPRARSQPTVSLPRFLSCLRWARVEPALLLSVFTPAPLAALPVSRSRHCLWGPSIGGPTCHRSALRRTSLFVLQSSLLS